MQITIFPSVRDTTSGRYISVHDAFKRIRNNVKQGELIRKIRSLSDKSERDKLKKQLPAYCFSGTFSRKNSNSCTQHSGLICLDFDGEKLENIMSKSEYIYACFLSPSGNGYKVLVKIPPSIEEHEEYFDSLQDYFNLPTFDDKVRNISTACFDTEDPNIYINEDAPMFNQKTMPKHKAITEVMPLFRIDDPDKIITRLQKWIDKTESFGKGGRNAYVAKLAMRFNAFGVPVSRAVNYLAQYEQPDFPWSEIDRTVRGIYARYANEHNTQAFEDREPIHFTKELLRKKTDNSEIKNIVSEKYHITPSQVDEIIDHANSLENEKVFWTVITGKDKSKIKIDSEALKEYYQRHGIYRFWIDKKTWMMIQEDNFKIKEIGEDKIRDHVNEYFESLPDKIDNFSKSYILKTIQDEMDVSYLKREKLAWLPARDIDWQEDTRDTAYFYYQNKAVKITKDSLELMDYSSELNGCIWEDQIIKRDIELLPEADVIWQCEYSQFIMCLALGQDPRKFTDESLVDMSGFYNLCETIGYILHSYKDPANPKSVILTDEVISENPEGGIGKGIFIKGIGQIKNSVVFDGKNWNWNKSFLFQRINLSTQVMAFEDVNRTFNFERLFSIVTEGIEVEKKNKDTFYIPYTRSPKVLITSNYAIKGQGGSHDRRRHEIELKQFFSPTYTPRDYFGHNLYDEWDTRQWMLFDNFMMLCVKTYLTNGLSKSNAKNISYKKLINDVPEEFIAWYDDRIQLGAETSLNAICEEFKAAYQDYKTTLNREMLKWLNKVAAHRGHAVHKDTRREGVYITINAVLR
jgi:hypothetical protein